MRLASSYIVLASSFQDLQAAEDAFFISNQRLTFDQAKLFCSEDGYLAEGNERNINNLVSGKSLWLNGEKVLNDPRDEYKKFRILEFLGIFDRKWLSYLNKNVTV